MLAFVIRKALCTYLKYWNAAILLNLNLLMSVSTQSLHREKKNILCSVIPRNPVQWKNMIPLPLNRATVWAPVIFVWSIIHLRVHFMLNNDERASWRKLIDMNFKRWNILQCIMPVARFVCDDSKCWIQLLNLSSVFPSLEDPHVGNEQIDLNWAFVVQICGKNGGNTEVLKQAVLQNKHSACWTAFWEQMKRNSPLLWHPLALPRTYLVTRRKKSSQHMGNLKSTTS